MGLAQSRFVVSDVSNSGGHSMPAARSEVGSIKFCGNGGASARLCANNERRPTCRICDGVRRQCFRGLKRAGKTILEKAGEAVGFGMAMAEDLAGAVNTAVGSAVATVTDVLSKAPAEAPARKASAKKAVEGSAVKKVAKKTKTQKPDKKAPSTKAAKEVASKKVVAKKKYEKGTREKGRKKGSS
jgi:hypothetical protein